MPRNTRTAHCPDCCLPGGKAGWTRTYNNDLAPVWECENCGTHSKPIVARKRRELIDQQVDDAKVGTGSDAFAYGYKMAKAANATPRQATEVGRMLQKLVDTTTLAEGDTEVHITSLSLHSVGQKLYMYAYGVCSASRQGTVLEVWGRKLQGLTVGPRGGLEYSDIQTSKRTTGWRAFYAALA